MGVEFEWRVSRSDGDWEVLAERHGRRRCRWPWWSWLILGLVLAAGVVGAYFWLRARYEADVQEAKFQIQAVMDLEARAFTRRDPAQFLELQDREEVEWYGQQTLRVQPDCPERLTTEQALRAYCVPVLPAEIAAIQLDRDVAWLDVVEGNPPLRKARFYRRTPTGWVHTAPPADFWERNEQVSFGTTLVSYNDRDLPHLRPTLDRIGETARDVCDVIYCPSASGLQVRYSVETPPLVAPHLVSSVLYQGEDTLVLSSPSLAGFPTDQESARAETVYWVAYALAARAILAVNNRDLSALQQAVVIENARWLATGDPNEAPILSRVAQGYSPDLLQQVFRDVRERDSLDQIVRFLLGGSSSEQPTEYFGALLGIERDALRIGRRETYLVLQDNRQPWWVEQQLLLFEQFQEKRVNLPPVSIQSVEMEGNTATVTLYPGSAAPAHIPGEAHFVLRGREWLHSSPVLAR
jgi:hypothetical protein